ncbi:hypothetical protein [Halarchaeum nitratireducens]|uniref:Uncharacterized protein n=1 Tax=Halarchaeum nitratireducens TaxID=489913 RepID=A0A830GEP6_9EURY|nr:hypothetical protein [Halarchaeum nitratireducens]GGN26146.1 hypothetical protein GCM10009021_30460 [Halarchaeum nitratireducens]
MGLFDKVTDAIGGNSEGEKDTTEVTGAFDVPAWAVEDRVNVDKRTEIIHEHYHVTEEQAHTIAQKLKEELESTEGYSQHSIISNLEDDLDLDYDLLETIVWTERASIETMDRVNTYLEQNDPDKLYKISGPDDDRTHPITREAMEEIEEKGGVTMEKLARILIRKAEKYEDEGGTPERMEHWVPHEKFRFSIVAHVDF